MIVKIGQTIQDTQRSGTYDGVTVQMYLVAQAVNVALGRADFNPAAVNVKVVLRQKAKTTVIMQDNLQILGLYASLKEGLNNFLDGWDKTYKAAAKKHVKLRSVFLPFGGNIRVAAGDELLVEIGVAQLGAVSSAVDAVNSYVEFYCNPSIGYMEYIPITQAAVIQAQTSKQQLNPGDNVTRLVYLNFDQNDLETEVVSNLSLQSDRLDLSLSFNQLLAHNRRYYGENENPRYGTSLPISNLNPTVFRGLDSYPQSLVLFDGWNFGKELDEVRLDIAFNSQQVVASQNYIVWTRYDQDVAVVLDAAKREQKHEKEKLDKVVENSTPAANK